MNQAQEKKATAGQPTQNSEAQHSQTHQRNWCKKSKRCKNGRGNNSSQPDFYKMGSCFVCNCCTNNLVCHE